MSGFLRRFLFSSCLSCKSEDSTSGFAHNVQQLEGQAKPLTSQVAAGQHDPGVQVSKHPSASDEANFSPFLMIPPGHALSESRAFSPPSYNTAIRQHGSHPSSEEENSHPALSHKQLLQVTNTRDLDTSPATPRSPLKLTPTKAKTLVKVKTPTPSPVSLYIRGQAPAKPRLAVSSFSPLASELKAYRQPKPISVVSRKPFRGGAPSMKVPAVPLPLPGKKARVISSKARVISSKAQRNHQINPPPAVEYSMATLTIHHAPPPPPPPPPPSPAAPAREGLSLRVSQPLVSRPTTPPRSSKQSLASIMQANFQEVSQIDWSDEGLKAFDDELNWIQKKLAISHRFPQDRSLHEAPWFHTPYNTPVKSHFVISLMKPAGEKDQNKMADLHVMDETLLG